MNIFKMFTRGGRQALVREAAKEALTPAAVIEWSAKAANETLMRALANVEDEKVRKVVRWCYDGADLCKTIAVAVEDKVISVDEAGEIYQKVAAILDTAMTQERIDALIEKVVAKVP